MGNKQIVLLDGNNIGFAALLGAKQRLSAGDLDTTGIYGFLRSLHVLRRDWAGRMIVLWDGKSWRYDEAIKHGIAYKGKREERPEQVVTRNTWRESRARLIPLIRSLGVAQITCANLEADDLAARLRRNPNFDSVLLVSGDEDWLGLINERTQVYDQRKERRVTLDSLKQMTGFDTPRQVVEFKALTGDTSDNIPGAGGIGEKTAMEILNTFGSVRSFANAVLTEPESRDKVSKRALSLIDDLSKMNRFESNLKLIDLDHPEAPKADRFITVTGPLDAQAFQAACDQYAFFSLTRDLNKWLAPFRLQ